MINFAENGNDGPKRRPNGPNDNGHGLGKYETMDGMVYEMRDIFYGNGIKYQDITAADFMHHRHIENVINSQVYYFSYGLSIQRLVGLSNISSNYFMFLLDPSTGSITAE